MRAWLAAACAIVLVGSILGDVADAGRRGGGRRGGGRNSGGGGGTAVISPDEVREAQTALTDRGLYADTVDGVMGPKTIAALKAFQAAEGLAQTGYLDRDSRARLGVQAPGTQ